MKSFRQSIHSYNNKKIRNKLISKRRQLKLSQRDLATILNVNHSLVGKVETGDRRLDLLEFIEYIKPLNMGIEDFVEFTYARVESKINLDIFNIKQQSKLFLTIKEKLLNLDNICKNFNFLSPDYQKVHIAAFEIVNIAKNESHINNLQKSL